MILCLCLPAAADSPLRIEGIRFGQSGLKTRMVIDLSAQTDFRAFLLDNPHRIVVDLPEAAWAIPKTRFVTGELVKKYRSGVLEDGLTRIIFDLSAPAVVSRIFTLPKNDFSKDRLVLDLAPSSPNIFTGHLDEIYGKKDLAGSVTRRDSAPVSSEFRALQNTQAKNPVAATPVPGKKPVVKYTVVIDAGHGGEDPGATSPGGYIKEKDINLAVAKELKRQLDETGLYKAVLTRNRDVYIKLRDRVGLSREVGADLFISIHADKIGRTGVRGASIYTLSETASDAETERLAENENNAGLVAGVDLSAESEDVANILLDLAMREKMNESNLLAHKIEEALRSKNVRLLPNSHRSAGFAVLKAPDVPAVLIETGFISNTSEAKLLTSPQFQSKVATGLVAGIDAYFRKIRALQRL